MNTDFLIAWLLGLNFFFLMVSTTLYFEKKKMARSMFRARGYLLSNNDTVSAVEVLEVALIECDVEVESARVTP